MPSSRPASASAGVPSKERPRPQSALAGRPQGAEAERWLELLGARAQLEGASILLEG